MKSDNILDKWEPLSADILISKKTHVTNTEPRRLLHNPGTLQNLALKAVFSQLVELCQAQNYSENKRGLKHYLKFQLAAPFRQLLLNMALSDGRIYSLTDLSMFELLVSPNVREVNVQSVRPFFREHFTRILEQLGNGLENLSIEDSSWLQSRGHLPMALTQMPQLRFVSLRYLANDAMLAALGRHCSHLQEIDVTGSHDVTDKGLERLCVPGEEDDKEIQCSCVTDPSQKRSRKLSAPAGIGGTDSKTGWLPRLVHGIRRRSFIHKSSIKMHSLVENEAELMVQPEEMPTPSTERCFKSLRKLSISGTRVTNVGVDIVLHYIPNISVVT